MSGEKLEDVLATLRADIPPDGSPAVGGEVGREKYTSLGSGSAPRSGGANKGTEQSHKRARATLVPGQTTLRRPL
jgi:hypothetical protein